MLLKNADQKMYQCYIFFYTVMLKKFKFYSLKTAPLFYTILYIVLYNNSLSRCLFNNRRTIINVYNLLIVKIYFTILFIS